MASFAPEWHFDWQGHFLNTYAEKIDFVPDDEQPYPDRIVGSVNEGPAEAPLRARAVIIPKPVGSENASRFRRWVTLPPTHWAAMTSRPGGWRYFILMVGLLPDGQPWWSALYEESTLAEVRDHSENMGGFYRFDPGLTAKALIADWDKDRPEYVDSPAVYALSIGHENAGTFRDQAEFVGTIWDYAAHQSEPVTGRIDLDGNRLSVHIE